MNCQKLGYLKSLVTLVMPGQSMETSEDSLPEEEKKSWQLSQFMYKDGNVIFLRLLTTTSQGCCSVGLPHTTQWWLPWEAPMYGEGLSSKLQLTEPGLSAQGSVFNTPMWKTTCRKQYNYLLGFPSPWWSSHLGKKSSKKQAKAPKMCWWSPLPN